MNIKTILIGAATIVTLATASSCDDNKSYAELLEDENQAVNAFLADQIVAESLPADNKFITGPNAPYYPLDDEGNLYIKIVSLGDGPMVEDNQLVYFRFSRYNLSYYTTTDDLVEEGNSNSIESGNMSFRYGNYTLESSSRWGTGIQTPLEYVPLNSEIWLVVKSQFGWSGEISYVQPYLYHLRYYPSQI